MNPLHTHPAFETFASLTNLSLSLKINFLKLYLPSPPQHTRKHSTCSKRNKVTFRTCVNSLLTPLIIEKVRLPNVFMQKIILPSDITDALYRISPCYAKTKTADFVYAACTYNHIAQYTKSIITIVNIQIHFVNRNRKTCGVHSVYCLFDSPSLYITSRAF